MDESLPGVNATMPNGDPGKLNIAKFKIIAVFNLTRSKNISLTRLKIIDQDILDVVNLKNVIHTTTLHQLGSGASAINNFSTVITYIYRFKFIFHAKVGPLHTMCYFEWVFGV